MAHLGINDVSGTQTSSPLEKQSAIGDASDRTGSIGNRTVKEADGGQRRIPTINDDATPVLTHQGSLKAKIGPAPTSRANLGAAGNENLDANLNAITPVVPNSSPVAPAPDLTALQVPLVPQVPAPNSPGPNSPAPNVPAPNVPGPDAPGPDAPVVPQNPAIPLSTARQNKLAQLETEFNALSPDEKAVFNNDTYKALQDMIKGDQSLSDAQIKAIPGLKHQLVMYANSKADRFGAERPADQHNLQQLRDFIDHHDFGSARGGRRPPAGPAGGHQAGRPQAGGASGADGHSAHDSQTLWRSCQAMLIEPTTYGLSKNQADKFLEESKTQPYANSLQDLHEELYYIDFARPKDNMGPNELKRLLTARYETRKILSETGRFDANTITTMMHGMDTEGVKALRPDAEMCDIDTNYQNLTTQEKKKILDCLKITEKQAKSWLHGHEDTLYRNLKAINETRSWHKNLLQPSVKEHLAIRLTSERRLGWLPGNMDQVNYLLNGKKASDLKKLNEALLRRSEVLDKRREREVIRGSAHSMVDIDDSLSDIDVPTNRRRGGQGFTYQSSAGNLQNDGKGNSLLDDEFDEWSSVGMSDDPFVLDDDSDDQDLDFIYDDRITGGQDPYQAPDSASPLNHRNSEVSLQLEPESYVQPAVDFSATLPPANQELDQAPADAAKIELTARDAPEDSTKLSEKASRAQEIPPDQTE